MIYWFTGQPGAGKTTLALELIKHLSNPIHIDGDNLRDILKNYDYTDSGRKNNIENVMASIFPLSIANNVTGEKAINGKSK